MARIPVPLDPAAWQVVNDDVMGGVSTARVARAGGALRFAGRVSLDFGGGFASARAPFVLPAAVGAACTACVARVVGDGRRYRLTAFVRTADGTRAAWHFQAPFATDGGEQALELPLAAFVARLRGRPVDTPPLAASDIVAVGLQISDRQAGPFTLDVLELALITPDTAR
jgi:monofunctional biosynthetic peptidoglycan transglycosylase